MKPPLTSGNLQVISHFIAVRLSGRLASRFVLTANPTPCILASLIFILSSKRCNLPQYPQGSLLRENESLGASKSLSHLRSSCATIVVLRVNLVLLLVWSIRVRTFHVATITSHTVIAVAWGVDCMTATGHPVLDGGTMFGQPLLCPSLAEGKLRGLFITTCGCRR